MRGFCEDCSAEVEITVHGFCNQCAGQAVVLEGTILTSLERIERMANMLDQAMREPIEIGAVIKC